MFFAYILFTSVIFIRSSHGYRIESDNYQNDSKFYSTNMDQLEEAIESPDLLVVTEEVTKIMNKPDLLEEIQRKMNTLEESNRNLKVQLTKTQARLDEKLKQGTNKKVAKVQLETKYQEDAQGEFSFWEWLMGIGSKILGNVLKFFGI